MEFIPENEKGPLSDVPYYGEARSIDGWQGQSTTRSFDSLKSDLTQAFSRLGGVVHSIQRGAYKINEFERSGAQIHYAIEGPNGQMVYGRMDVAALPVKKPKRSSRYQETIRKRHEAALSMALYNVIEALKAQWVLKQLNPSYIPLMPWLLADDGRTISQAYIESGIGQKLLPSLDGVMEGEFRLLEEEMNQD